MSIRFIGFKASLWLCFVASTLAQERAFWSVKPLQPNQSLFWISTSYFDATEEFAVAGFRRDLFRVATTDETSFPVTDARFIDRVVALHYEYGYSRKLTIAGYLGFRGISTTYTETDYPQGVPTFLAKIIRSSGFTDLWLWGRYELLNPIRLKFPFRLAAQAGVKLPTGDILAPVPLGTGMLDYEARLLGELTFFVNRIPAYLVFDAGYRLRGGDYKDQTLYRAELGLSAAQEVLLRVGLSGLASLGKLGRLIGIGEIPRPAATRPLNILGDERYGQITLGLQANFSPTFAVLVDYQRRLYGNATFFGESVQVSVALLR
ncbi:MAG: hypothetical protein NZM06_11430 [Chloroherpetonaceae bacterium]|nr:hypothetical protein [Chloroherpetonaceae bacterium]MDW8438308.1 hypothetical protein [Chloroherpetonaceae bacterium]